jgi:hypothetical protein
VRYGGFESSLYLYGAALSGIGHGPWAGVWEAVGRISIVQPQVPTDRSIDRTLRNDPWRCRIVAKHSVRLKLVERAVDRKNPRTTSLICSVARSRFQRIVRPSCGTAFCWFSHNLSGHSVRSGESGWSIARSVLAISNCVLAGNRCPRGITLRRLCWRLLEGRNVTNSVSDDLWSVPRQIEE